MIVAVARRLVQSGRVDRPRTADADPSTSDDAPHVALHEDHGSDGRAEQDGGRSRGDGTSRDGSTSRDGDPSRDGDGSPRNDHAPSDGRRTAMASRTAHEHGTDDGETAEVEHRERHAAKEAEEDREVAEAAQDQGLVAPRSADRPEHEDLTPETAFRRTVEEGRRRLERPVLPMTATGFVGGLDVSIGVLALLLVYAATGSELLAGLAFSIGFVALLLAGSELFTEGFLVPVSAVVARKTRVRYLFRLWGITIVTNLAAGWAATWVIIAGFPDLQAVFVEKAVFFVDLGYGWRAFALAILAGVVITVMTWTQNSTESVPTKVATTIGLAFLLAGGQLYHSILDSLLMFGALHTGEAPFGYADWLPRFLFAAAGNVVGGLGLVTVLRLLQVPERVARERERAEL